MNNLQATITYKSDGSIARIAYFRERKPISESDLSTKEKDWIRMRLEDPTLHIFEEVTIF